MKSSPFPLMHYEDLLVEQAELLRELAELDDQNPSLMVKGAGYRREETRQILKRQLWKVREALQLCR